MDSSRKLQSSNPSSDLPGTLRTDAGACYVLRPAGWIRSVFLPVHQNNEPSSIQDDPLLTQCSWLLGTVHASHDGHIRAEGDATNNSDNGGDRFPGFIAEHSAHSESREPHEPSVRECI
jgi:hypothetical protein